MVIVVVHEVVVVSAQQYEVGDVGAAAGLPGDDVVGFASRWCCVADGAAAVASDECSPLGVGGEPDAVAVPQGLTLLTEQQPVEV